MQGKPASIILFLLLVTTLVLVHNVQLVKARPRSTSIESSSIVFFEGFDDDFDAGRNIPDLVDASLSSSFSAINERRPTASHKLTIRDRDILWQPGDPLYPGAWVDFTDGGGTYMTFRFNAGSSYIITSGNVSFAVVAYGGDGGHLFKYVSSDGVTFTQVGTDSDAMGTYSFPVATGGSSTYFRLQVGTSAGIYEGIHVDNIKAYVTVSPSPPPPTTYILTITTLLRGTTDPSSGTHAYPPGTNVSITATPYSDYGFDHWMLDGVNVGSNNPINVLMDENQTLNAIFAVASYSVTVRAYCYNESAEVSVSITMDGVDTGYTTPHKFTGLLDTHTFTVPSTDANGHPFLSWNTGQTTTTITVSSGGTCVAYYQAAAVSRIIFINADGSISPPTAPIFTSDHVTYILTDNINGSIVIRRSNIVIDGNGYTLQGTGVEAGIDLSETANVTVQRTQIEGFYWGIFGIPPGYGGVTSNTILGNNITNNYFGIAFGGIAGNVISENNIANNTVGIELDYETIIIQVGGAMPPLIYFDRVFGNNIAYNHFGILLHWTEYCRIYHNNFMGNYQQAQSDYSITWDLGYPQGGNFWSDYNGTDVYSGPYQNETGSDGIGDTPYVIDSNNADNYPLMQPWAGVQPWAGDVAVTNVTVVVPHCSSNVGNGLWVFQGLPVYVNVTVLNKGYFDENVTVTLYYNITANQIIGAQNVTLSRGQNETVAFLWDTTGVPYCQNYTITAVATIPLDNNPADNTLAIGPMTVRIMGDINADGKVDGRDIILVARAFTSYGPDYECAGSAPSPGWNLDCDINGDNKVDGRDLILVARNFGK
jgi:parallel beta-helix repeat protein